jgi:hypothetical protein
MGTSKVSVLLEKINKTLLASEFPGLSAIEYDILMQHIRELYDEINSLRAAMPTKALNMPEHDDKSIKSKSDFFITQPADVVVKEVVKEHTTELGTELKNEAKNVLINDWPAAKPEIQPDKISKPASINESVTQGASLNEKLKSTSTEIHQKLSTKPLKDLIDINKRFVLVNELFKGSADRFNEAIAYIDSLQELSDAEAYINLSLAKPYSWDITSVSARLFIKLVKQKYGQA